MYTNNIMRCIYKCACIYPVPHVQDVTQGQFLGSLTGVITEFSFF